MVELTRKPSESLASWFEWLWADYRASMIDAGIRAESADENIRSHKERLFVDGLPVAGQHVLDVLDAGEVVGTMWLSEPASSDPGTWFIYDVVIDEQRRGHGYGRQAMEAAERFVREAGATRMALNVFGPNVVARNLYESLGYEVMAVSMFKDLAV